LLKIKRVGRRKLMRNVSGVFTSALGKILPEGRLKEFLRSCYYRTSFDGYNRGLAALSEIVTRAELLEDGPLLVELNNGMKFYAPRDREAYRPLIYTIKYGKPQKLSRVKELEYFWGTIAVLREIFVDNIYQQHYELKRGDTVIDIGAHIGIFAVKAARAVEGNEGLVIAIEPDSSNLKFLQKNINENTLKNVITVQEGVWSKKDQLKLYLGCHSTTSGFYLQEWQSSEFTEVEVDTLDNILKELDIKRVDFIKMDVEGAEIEALKGMRETLLNQEHVKLAISAYHKQDGKATYKTIVPWLESEGFRVREENGIVYGARGNLKRGLCS
jgi:FkbM family methyltransferase